MRWKLEAGVSRLEPVGWKLEAWKFEAEMSLRSECRDIIFMGDASACDWLCAVALQLPGKGCGVSGMALCPSHYCCDKSFTS